MAAAQNSTPQSPAGRPARSLLIGATLLAMATVLAARQDTTAAAEKPKETIRPRMVLLDARVVAMKPRYRSQLGTWQKVTLHDDESAVSPEVRARRTKSNRPIKAEVLTASDLASTESLLTQVKELEENERLYITTNPQLVADDSRDVLVITIHQEWFMLTRYEKNCTASTPRGPTMSMTVHIVDGNDIILSTAFEDSDRRGLKHREDNDSESILQRTKTHGITLKNGGTMAWAGLVQCDPRNERPSGLGRLPLIGGLFRSQQAAKRTKETVIFVTAYLIPEPPRQPTR